MWSSSPPQSRPGEFLQRQAQLHGADEPVAGERVRAAAPRIVFRVVPLRAKALADSVKNLSQRRLVRLVCTTDRRREAIKEG